MNKYCINKAPKWKEIDEFWPVFDEPRKEYFGEEMKWPKGYSPDPVFIEQFQILNAFPSTKNNKVYDLFLFGFRFNQIEAECDFPVEENSHFVEYILVEYIDKKIQNVIKLQQHERTTYSDIVDDDDVLYGDEFSYDETNCIYKLPNWSSSEYEWPTLEKSPMKFIGQASLEKNDVTDKVLTNGETLFLFVGEFKSCLKYKLISIDQNYQSIDEHYLLEGLE